MILSVTVNVLYSNQIKRKVSLNIHEHFTKNFSSSNIVIPNVSSRIQSRATFTQPCKENNVKPSVVAYIMMLTVYDEKTRGLTT